jgi:hypothetical protein
MHKEMLGLGDIVRKHMVAEIRRDMQRGNLYVSERLRDTGKKMYPDLLVQAAGKWDHTWLASQLRLHNCMKQMELKRTPNGASLVSVPPNAGQMLAEEEFHRFLLRGLCVQAIESAGGRLVVCAAGNGASLPPEEEAKIGAEINAHRLLEDLRRGTGVETVLGRGLTVRLP